MYDLYDRVLGCLVASGMGDAMGAPTETYSAEEIKALYGGRVTEFKNCDLNRIAYGNIAGEVTDDTSQMWEMLKAIIRCNGNLTVKDAGEALVAWSEDFPRYYPSNAGPTTRVIIDMVKKGEDPSVQAKASGYYLMGTTNGAIMRIAGAGAANPGDIEGAIRTAINMTACSHGTQIAYSAAACIAAAIAEALRDGSDVHSVLKASIYGARRGEEIGKKEARIAAGARVLPKVLKAIDIAYAAKDPIEAEEMLNDEMGTDSSAICQACGIAIGLFAANDGDPKGTIISGANIGGDCDTLACIAAAISGALKGYSAIPDEWKPIFKEANPEFDFEWAAKELVRIIESKN